MFIYLAFFFEFVHLASKSNFVTYLAFCEFCYLTVLSGMQKDRSTPGHEFFLKMSFFHTYIFFHIYFIYIYIYICIYLKHPATNIFQWLFQIYSRTYIYFSIYLKHPATHIYFKDRTTHIISSTEPHT